MRDSFRTGNGFPRGQFYGDIAANAEQEERVERDALFAASQKRLDRVIVQDEGTITFLPDKDGEYYPAASFPQSGNTFDTSRGVLPLRAGDNVAVV